MSIVFKPFLQKNFSPPPPPVKKSLPNPKTPPQKPAKRPPNRRSPAPPQKNRRNAALIATPASPPNRRSIALTTKRPPNRPPSFAPKPAKRLPTLARRSLLKGTPFSPNRHLPRPHPPLLAARWNAGQKYRSRRATNT